jgi:hypothetical protein
MSGRHVVITQMSSPTPPLYLICIANARLVYLEGSVGPVAALNFFSHVESVGRGVGLLAVRGTFLSHELSYFAQNFEMYV